MICCRGENIDTARLELYQLTGEGLLKKED